MILTSSKYYTTIEKEKPPPTITTKTTRKSVVNYWLKSVKSSVAPLSPFNVRNTYLTLRVDILPAKFERQPTRRRARCEI